VNRSVVFAASAMSMIGGLASAEAPSVRPGLWETIGQTTIEFAPALEHEAKPAVSEKSRLCVNDGKALGGGWADPRLGRRLSDGSSVVHVVSDRKVGIVSHGLRVQLLRFSMVSPWVRWRAEGSATLVGQRMVLRGDFRRRLYREISMFSWLVPPDGTRRGISSRTVETMERTGRCPSGTSSAPIVPLPATPKPAPAP
jgi:hypothetical protein